MIRAQSTVDHLTGVEELLLDRQLVLNGVFKGEIERLKKVQADAEEALGMIDTVKAADQYRKDADAYGTATRGAADKAAATATGALAQANAKMDAALNKEKSVAKRESDAIAIMEDYDHRAKTFDADCAKREAALATREAALSAGQQKLSEDAAKLSARQREVLEKLDAAKALASA